MIQEWEDTTNDWYNSLPYELQSVYTMNGSKHVTQVPVLIELLRLSGHQGYKELMQELSQGFEMTGPLTPGTGWLTRVDGRYSNPISDDEFRIHNLAYVRAKLHSARPSSHWRAMLDELLDEKAKGRVEGPLQAPANWKVTLRETEAGPVSPVPTDRAQAAMCFAVVQSDKVRRCEDYRRSHHNSTVSASDTPHYADVEGYVNIIRHLQQLGLGLSMVWGQDLSGAYRQLPVRPGETAYTLLALPSGHSLWRHHATPFGAVASVWAFCRFGDGLTSLARRLLVILTGHFVDDWTGVELAATAASSCSCFKSFFQQLGLAMKAEKEQPPSTRQKVLGVIIHIQAHEVTVEMCPKRRQKLLGMLGELLMSNYLSPDDAQRLAGKLGFMATTLFGGMGMAAIQPFYARAHCLGEQSNYRLTFALKSSIHILQQLLMSSRPRTFPWHHEDDRPRAVIYSDAFFQLGERLLRPREAPELWNPQKRKPVSNGWGFVVKLQDRVIYANGELPRTFIEKFVSRKAFIYMMGILAAVMATIYLRAWLPPYFIMFIDNQAGRCALQKGYGKDPKVNTIITAFWSLAAHEAWFPAFQYVKSDLNISDPVSRHNTSFAENMGWDRLQVDTSALLLILEGFSQDPEASIQSLLNDLLSLGRTPCGVVDVHGVAEKCTATNDPVAPTLPTSRRWTKDGEGGLHANLDDSCHGASG